MLVEKEDFDKLCPTYQQLIRDLEEKYSVIPEEKFHKKWKLLKEFSLNYLMIPKLWEEYLKMLRRDRNLNVETMLSELICESNYAHKKARFHFCDLYGRTEGCLLHYYFKKLLHYKPDPHFYNSSLPIHKALPVESIINKLICPQAGMDRTLRYYEENAFSPLPKNVYEKFEKAKKLYAEIFKARNDQVKWFELITQVDNEKYVINNIDYRLSKDLNNVELWKLYMDYLRSRNPQRLLRLYSYYCRYFIDDHEIKKEYEEAIKLYGPSIVYWKNPFPFETYQADPDLGFPYIPSPTPIITPRQPQGVFSNFEPQCFSLPKTIMAYVKDICCPKILHKLHKCCKYFFVTIPYPVCHNFEVSTFWRLENNTIFFNQQSMSFYGVKVKLNCDRKIILSNKLNCYCEPLFTSKAFSNIYQCCAKYIHIRSWSEESTMIFKDFQFLVGHGNVEALYLQSVKIIDNEAKEAIGVEEILKSTPRIIDFQMLPTTTTLHTYEILLKFNFKNKFQLLNLYYIPSIEPYGFCEFLKRNLDQTAHCTAYMSNEIDEDTRKQARDVFAKELKDYWKGNPKPSISF